MSDVEKSHCPRVPRCAQCGAEYESPFCSDACAEKHATRNVEGSDGGPLPREALFSVVRDGARFAVWSGEDADLAICKSRELAEWIADELSRQASGGLVTCGELREMLKQETREKNQAIEKWQDLEMRLRGKEEIIEAVERAEGQRELLRGLPLPKWVYELAEAVDAWIKATTPAIIGGGFTLRGHEERLRVAEILESHRGAA